MNAAVVASAQRLYRDECDKVGNEKAGKRKGLEREGEEVPYRYFFYPLQARLK